MTRCRYDHSVQLGASGLFESRFSRLIPAPGHSTKSRQILAKATDRARVNAQPDLGRDHLPISPPTQPPSLFSPPPSPSPSSTLRITQDGDGNDTPGIPNPNPASKAIHERQQQWQQWRPRSRGVETGQIGVLGNVTEHPRRPYWDWTAGDAHRRRACWLGAGAGDAGACLWRYALDVSSSSSSLQTAFVENCGGRRELRGPMRTEGTVDCGPSLRFRSWERRYG